MQNQSEVTLGSEAQFSALFVERMNDLKAYATYVTGDAFVADDVLGEVYLSCLRAIRNGKGPTVENFEFYVRASIRNGAVSFHQDRSNESPLEGIADLEARLMPLYAPESATPTWDAETMRKSFEALPQRDREVLYLAEVERKKHAEIAAKLGIRTNTVSVIVHRAKESLRIKYLELSGSTMPTCGRATHSQLALFVRGALSARRLETLGLHLAECETCQGVVKRMLSLRLPVGVIIGFAVVSEAMRTAPAVASTAGHTLWAKIAAKPAMLLSCAAAGVGAITLASVVAVMAQNLPADSEGSHATSEGVAASVASTGDSDATKWGNSATENTSSPIDESVGAPRAMPEETTPDPAGLCPVPSLVSRTTFEWLPTGPEFSEGVSGAKLILRLHNAETENPRPYIVRVTAAPGSTLTNPTTNCTIVNGVLSCRVSGAKLTADSFEFPVTLTVGAGYEAVLPRVSFAAASQF